MYTPRTHPSGWTDANESGYTYNVNMITDTKDTLRYSGDDLQGLQSTTQLIRCIRVSHCRDVVRIPVELPKILYRPRYVRDLRAGSMQGDDFGIRRGDYLVIKRETFEDD